MAKCKGCGVELLDGTVFCPYCGAQVEKDEAKNLDFVDVNETSSNEFEYTGTNEPKQESKAFKIFAILGQVFGIVSLVFLGFTLLMSTTSLEAAGSIAMVGCEFGVPGFVFSIIGKKSKIYRGRAVFGFVANLVCFILLFILAVAFMVAAMLEGGYDPSNGVYF